jgi:hypothetical protein
VPASSASQRAAAILFDVETEFGVENKELPLKSKKALAVRVERTLGSFTRRINIAGCRRCKVRSSCLGGYGFMDFTKVGGLR